MRKLSGYGPSLVVLITAAAVLFLGPAAVQRLTYERTRTEIKEARHNLNDTDVLERLNQAYRDIATVVEPSVVHISAQYMDRSSLIDRPGTSTGSGWIFDTDGHVVTNYHVVENAERIDVQLYNGKLREAALIGADPSTDIAVLKIAPGLLHPAELAPLDMPVKQGDLVFAFGSPFDFRFSMSSGVVSGKDRSVGVLRDGVAGGIGYENFIQVDAAINPGNSGGPLTDYRGRVIGMNTAIATGRHTSLEDGQFGGIGLAIPLDMILPAVTQLIQNGYVEKGFLGVNVATTTDDNLNRLATLGFSGTGVVITGVRKNGAAAAAGVQENDIVTQVNGRAVASVPQLQSIVSSMLPGEKAALRIWRTNQEKQTSQMYDIEVPLAKLDLLYATGRLTPQQARDSIIPMGIARMTTSTPSQAAALNIEYRPGVLIEAVVPNSRLADSIGPGAIIVAVNDFPIQDVNQFITILRTIDLKTQGARAEAYLANGERTTLRLQLD